MEIQLQSNGVVDNIKVDTFPKLNNLQTKLGGAFTLQGVELLAYDDFGDTFKDLKFVDGGGNEMENINIQPLVMFN